MTRNWQNTMGVLLGAMLIALAGCPALEVTDDATGEQGDGDAVVDVTSNGSEPAPDTTSSESGAVLFADNGCATCHAADGTGGIGPSIRDASVASLDSVLRAAGSTHSGGTLPDLSDQDLTDLASFLGTTTSDSTDDTTDSGSSIHTVDAKGSGVLHGSGLSDPMANCTVCHGADLFGSGNAPACWGCHGSIWDGAPDYPPTHTRSEEGFRHSPGLESPIGNCDSCHGANLTGTPLIPSCFTCHGAKWNGEDDGDDDDDDD
jgi:cytochrome c553